MVKAEINEGKCCTTIDGIQKDVVNEMCELLACFCMAIEKKEDPDPVSVEASLYALINTTAGNLERKGVTIDVRRIGRNLVEGIK